MERPLDVPSNRETNLVASEAVFALSNVTMLAKTVVSVRDWSEPPIQDLDEGEVIWLVPKLSAQYRLQRWHWEMLSLDESSVKLQAARTVRRAEFETTLRSKLGPL